MVSLTKSVPVTFTVSRKPIAKELGLKTLTTPSQLRSYFVTYQAKINKVPLPTIKEYMGHVSMVTTEKYYMRTISHSRKPVAKEDSNKSDQPNSVLPIHAYMTAGMTAGRPGYEVEYPQLGNEAK